MKSTLLLVLLVLLGLAAGPAAGQVPSGKVLNISDIHFGSDKYVTINGKTMKLYDWLQTMPVSKWQAEFKKYDDKEMYLYDKEKHDTNYWLLASTLDQMKAQCPKPDFIVITGDMLSHNLTYTPATTPHFELMKGIYQFLVAQIHDRFPTATVLPGLGNNDTDRGNRNPPSAKFLKMFAEEWSILIPAAQRPQFMSEIEHRGSYSYALPGAPGNQLIMLNTVVFDDPGSAAYDKEQQDRADAELKWLATQLPKVGPAGHCWLAMHIPYGISSIATAGNCPGCLKNGATGTNASKASILWKSANVDAYLKAILPQAAAIQVGLSGHIHMDEFRFLTPAGTGKPVAFLHGTPSISPYYNNNPAFQVLDYNPATLELQNSTTYFLKLHEDGHPGPTPGWQPEYTFSTAYPVVGKSGITLASLELVWGSLEKFTTAQQQRYATYYKVSSVLPSYRGPLLHKEFWPYYWCTIGYTTRTDYCNCLQKWKKNNP